MTMRMERIHMFKAAVDRHLTGVLPCLLIAFSIHAGNASTPVHQPSGLSTFQPFNLSTGSYTNHAGNAISGWPVALTQSEVVLAESATTNAYPLSIFPESEQRRIAADFVLRQGGGPIGQLRVPAEVRRAVEGARKATERSRKRAAKGLCPQEESDAFCAETLSALRRYLDKQVESGAITPAERAALGR